MSIKDMVRDGKKVKFLRFDATSAGDEALFYETECGFEFPVPFEETKGGTFLAEDKAMMFMRWIRKHKKLIDESK